MAYKCREVVLEYPVQRFGEEVEDIWCGSAAEAEDDVVVELLLPSEAEQVPVFAPNRDVSEGGLEIKFDKSGALSGSDDVSDCAVNHVILDRGFRVGDAVVNGPILGPRKVMYAANLRGTLPGYRAEWRATEILERWFEKRTGSPPVGDLRGYVCGQSGSCSR
jgi:hypothetical protein